MGERSKKLQTPRSVQEEAGGIPVAEQELPAAKKRI